MKSETSVSLKNHRKMIMLPIINISFPAIVSKTKYIYFIPERQHSKTIAHKGVFLACMKTLGLDRNEGEK